MSRQLLNSLVALTAVLAFVLAAHNASAVPIPPPPETACKKCQCIMWTRFAFKPSDDTKYGINLIKVGNGIPVPCLNSLPTFTGQVLPPGQQPDPGEYWVSLDTIADNKAGPWSIDDCRYFQGESWDRSAIIPATLAFVQEYSSGTKACTRSYNLMECTDVADILGEMQPAGWYQCVAVPVPPE